MKKLLISLLMLSMHTLSQASVSEGQAIVGIEQNGTGAVLIKGEAAKSLFDSMGEETLSPTRTPDYFAKNGKQYSCSTKLQTDEYKCIIHIQSVEKAKIRKR